MGWFAYHLTQLFLGRLRQNERAWHLCCLRNYLINSQGSLICNEGLNDSLWLLTFIPKNILYYPLQRILIGTNSLCFVQQCCDCAFQRFWKMVAVHTFLVDSFCFSFSPKCLIPLCGLHQLCFRGHSWTWLVLFCLAAFKVSSLPLSLKVTISGGCGIFDITLPRPCWISWKYIVHTSNWRTFQPLLVFGSFPSFSL